LRERKHGRDKSKEAERLCVQTKGVREAKKEGCITKQDGNKTKCTRLKTEKKVVARRDMSPGKKKDVVLQRRVRNKKQTPVGPNN